jgi:hypothetical protein
MFLDAISFGLLLLLIGCHKHKKPPLWSVVSRHVALFPSLSARLNRLFFFDVALSIVANQTRALFSTVEVGCVLLT